MYNECNTPVIQHRLINKMNESVDKEKNAAKTINKCSDRSLGIASSEIITDRRTNQPTDQPTDQQSDRRGHREVTHLIKVWIGSRFSYVIKNKKNGLISDYYRMTKNSCLTIFYIFPYPIGLGILDTLYEVK